MTETELVGPREAMAQLERILQSNTFKKAKQQSALLRYVVVKTLRGEEISSADINAHIYGPNCSDLGKVRTSVNLVRERLAAYYGTEGQSDLVIVQIKPGSGYKVMAIYNECTESLTLYRKAKFYQRGMDLDSFEKAFYLFSSALDLDPENSLLLSDFSEFSLLRSILEDLLGSVPVVSKHSRERSEWAALEAIRVNPTHDWRARLMLGLVRVLEGNEKQARKNINSALRINRHAVENSLWWALALGLLSEVNAARKAVEYHLLKTPESIGANLAGAFLYYLLKEYDLALACCDIAGGPNVRPGDLCLLIRGLILLARRGLTAAWSFQEIQREGIRGCMDSSWLHRLPDHMFGYISMCMSYQKNREDAAAYIAIDFHKRYFPEESVQKMYRGQLIDSPYTTPKPMQMALASLAVGQIGRVFVWLRRARRDGNALTRILHLLPVFESILTHKRFEEYASKPYWIN